MNPKVSIVIPVYNGSNYLKEAIDSALSQTYKNIEIIVVNDGSNDNGATEQIARSYGNKIRYYQKENGGVATALNLGIGKMKGEYFSWLSHDDKYYPEKIQKQIETLASTKAKNIIAICDWTIINEDSHIVSHCVIDGRLELFPMGFLAFDTTTWLNACAMLIPADAIIKSGGFDESLRTTQDYDMHLRLIKMGMRYKVIHEPLLYSRVHSNQGSVCDPAAAANSDDIHEVILSCLDESEVRGHFNNDFSRIASVYEAYLLNRYKKSAPIFADMMISILDKDGNSKLAKKLSRRVFARKIISARLKDAVRRRVLPR